jgi:hypothetical protein
MATLTTRPRRIDLDDQGEFIPEPETPHAPDVPGFSWVPGVSVRQGGIDVPTTLQAGQTIHPAYIVVYLADGTPLYRSPLNCPEAGVTLLPGESLTISATLRVD